MFDVYCLPQLKAIRLKCLDCSGFQQKEVSLCQVTNCPLWPFRLGKLPKNDFKRVKLAVAREKLEGMNFMSSAEAAEYDKVAEKYL